MKTQSEKILEALKLAGPAGVSNYDLNDIAFRYSARIKDLRDRGHKIEAVKGKGSNWTFILHTKPVQARMFEITV